MFGLSWIGDDATIKRMTLLIMSNMCEIKSPAVIAIFVCTVHMVDGKSKMLNSLCPYSHERMMILIHEKHILTPSSLMGQQMFRKYIFWHYSIVACQELVK